MKKGILFFSILTVSIALSSCKKLLNEDVRTQVTDEYLNSASGFKDGVNASYSFLKSFYGGDENGASMTIFGTDEYTNGFDGALKSLNTYNAQLIPTYSATTNVWNSLYTAINSCNAVISRAPNVTGIDDALKNVRVAEARFLRAQYYFILVQQYGGVHLSLTETQGVVTEATRSSVADVYKAIIADLDFAVATLPVKATDYGRATKPAAENLLSKVYLAKAGSSAKATDDYTKAAALAESVIKNYGFKLVDDFAKVFEQGAAEKSTEVIWSVQNSKDLLTIGLGNTLHLYYTVKYDDQIGMVRDLANGRPYARFKPTDYTLVKIFDRVNDSRYTKSFRRVLYCNAPGTYTINGHSVTMKVGDTAVYVPDFEMTAAEIAKKNYTVYTPSKQNERVFPALDKYADPQRGDVNEMRGSRDLLVMRLAETYLNAAEALMMGGKNAEAAAYVNIVRTRAAKVGNTPAETAAYRAAMQVTAADMNIDFILDERSRELLGEMTRWFDLVRTGKLVSRVKLYNPVAAVGIKDYHVLRPIPQTQIDRTSIKFEQNPGY